MTIVQCILNVLILSCIISYLKYCSTLRCCDTTSFYHSGVGFSFIFSWVLMGVVTSIFLAGGNMEKLVCEPFHTKEVFKASHMEIIQWWSPKSFNLLGRYGVQSFHISKPLNEYLCQSTKVMTLFIHLQNLLHKRQLRKSDSCSS